jgi:hypothetical protein
MRIEIVHADGTRTTPRIVPMASGLQTSRGHVGFDWPPDLPPPAPGERIELELDDDEWATRSAMIEW